MRVTDLSFGGGHVETPAIFIPGDPVSVVMILDGEEVTVSGTVVYTHAGMGFGFEFDLAASPASSQERIARFLKARGIDTADDSGSKTP